MTKSERLAQKKAAKAAATTATTKAEKTESAKPAKVTKVAKAELEKSNATVVAKKITKEKELKYNYPEDIDSLPKRKTFRQTARTKMKAYDKKIAQLRKSVDEKDKALLSASIKERNTYAKSTYIEPELIG